MLTSSPAGIRLTLRSEGRVIDTFVLDQPAKGGIAASRINNADDAQDDLMVRTEEHPRYIRL